MLMIYQARVKYRSGTYSVRVYSDKNEYDVGAEVNVLVPSGYETTAVITQVLNAKACQKLSSSKCIIIDNPRKKEEEEEMEQIITGQIIVKVKHHCSERTCYCYSDYAYGMGDTVVYEADNGWHVGIVTDGAICDNSERWSIMQEQAGHIKYWVISKVDTDGYKARVAKSKELSRLKKELERKKKQYQELELLNLIAANDPETATLLEAYKTLMFS